MRSPGTALGAVEGVSVEVARVVVDDVTRGFFFFFFFFFFFSFELLQDISKDGSWTHLFGISFAEQ